MLQASDVSYMTSSLRDRSPPTLKTQISTSGHPLTSSLSVATGRLSDEHYSSPHHSKHGHYHHHQARQQRFLDLSSSLTNNQSPSPPPFRQHIGVLQNGGGQISPPSSVSALSGLYRSSAVAATATSFGCGGGVNGDGAPVVHPRLMNSPTSPSYQQQPQQPQHHHHTHPHQHVIGHGYSPFGPGPAPVVDQGLFYSSAVMAAALQHVESADTWRTALSQSSPSLWPYNASSMGLYPCVGAGGYVGIDSRRKNATRESTSTLKAWLYEHIKNPYPTKGEKIMLAIITKMTLTQVSTWFANARRRLKKENKMQWSTDGKAPDDDDDDENNEDNEDDVIDVSNDNEEFKDDENDLDREFKAAANDELRLERHQMSSSALKQLPVFDVIHKHIGSADFPERCLNNNNGINDRAAGFTVDATSPTFHVQCEPRSSAFHLPPPVPLPNPSLMSLILPSRRLHQQQQQQLSNHLADAIGLTSPLLNSIEQRIFQRAVADGTSRAIKRTTPPTMEADNSRPTSGHDGHPEAPPNVLKPRPRIWSLADVAMSTTTTSRRRSNGDDVISTGGGRHVGGSSNAFQPWTPCDAAVKSEDRRMKMESSDGSGVDVEDRRRQRKISTSADDIVAGSPQQRPDDSWRK